MAAQTAHEAHERRTGKNQSLALTAEAVRFLV